MWECILCFCCSTACPSYWWSGDRYLGPAVLLQAYRWLADGRDEAAGERLDNLEDPFRPHPGPPLPNLPPPPPQGHNPSNTDPPRTTPAAPKAQGWARPFDSALAVCRQIRDLPTKQRLAITPSFVGKRNYTTDEIKQACADGITERQGWAYSETDEAADLTVRIFIEGETAQVGLRLGARPVSKRPYKQHNIPGSLKPAVAASLARLVNIKPGLKVLDPCCGAGTILIEAQGYGAEVEGGDSSPEAINATLENAQAANVPVKVQTWDAQALPIATGSMDRVISNLPWGREVSTSIDLKTLYAEIGREIRRVLAPNGQAILLTNQPELLTIDGLHCERQIEISLYGQTPTITIWK